MVCMMSSTGRTIFQVRFERAERMPSGTPITAQNSTEVMIMARVVMVWGHSPIMSMKAKPTRVKMAMALPAHFQAASAKAAVVTIQGRKLKKSSSPLSTKVIGTCAARKAGRKLGTSQPRTKPLTQSAKGRVRRSPGLSSICALLCVGWGGIGGRLVFGRSRLLSGKLGEHVLGLHDPDQPVLVVGDRDGQARAGRAIEVGELLVR